jgi:hypothetical protein
MCQHRPKCGGRPAPRLHVLAAFVHSERRRMPTFTRESPVRVKRVRPRAAVGSPPATRNRPAHSLQCRNARPRDDISQRQVAMSAPLSRVKVPWEPCPVLRPAFLEERNRLTPDWTFSGRTPSTTPYGATPSRIENHRRTNGDSRAQAVIGLPAKAASDFHA